jgi:2-iminobutanoate/2-iminopropanoate deaminase
MKQIIKSKEAPNAIGPYSQAVMINNTLYTSGQLPIDPSTGKLVIGISAQTEQVLENMGSILMEAGFDYKDVVKCTCLLSDLANFGAMNEIYEKYFDMEPPARTTFAVAKLPLDALIEIDCIAVKQLRLV